MKTSRKLYFVLAILIISDSLIWLYLSLNSFHHWNIWYLVYFKSESEERASEELAVQREQTRRQYLITKYCSSDPPGTALSIITEPRSKVSYCLSRKISSTFWLQVLTYLDQEDHNMDLKQYSPLDIRKLDVQLRPRLNYYGLDNELHRKIIFNTTRFMFVRNPYSRLWSVFMDKFVNMDWWFLKRFGTVILRNKGVNVTSTINFCSKYYEISFQDFLDFVVYWNYKTGGQMDDHFGTVINHCNPCKYKPNFVGKLETFEQDSRHVLNLLKFGEFADAMTFTDRPLQEMHLLIDYNYYMFMQKFKKCISLCLARLLDVFMMNGYLTFASVKRLKLRLPLSKDSLIQEVTTEYWKSNRTLRQISLLKRKWKIHAYKKISRKTLSEIGQIYEKEALMFGYDPFPNDIFIKDHI